MPKTPPRLLALLLAWLALGAGCQKPPFVVHQIERPTVAALRFNLQGGPMDRAHVQSVSAVNWIRGDMTLSNANTGFSRSLDFSAIVDPLTGSRHATGAFVGLPSGPGYACQVRLYGDGGASLASGQANHLTLKPGANAVTVALSVLGQRLAVGSSGLVTGSLGGTFATSAGFGVQRVAGAPQEGLFDGSASASNAEFRELSGLEADASGNLYVADAGNHEIRLIPAGAPLSGGPVRAIAGDGTPGFSPDGTSAGSAELNAPRALLRTAAGDLFFCDTGNGRVRYISGGVLYTYAGGGANPAATLASALDARLNSPVALDADASGDLYVAEYPTGRILRIAPDQALAPVANLAPGSVRALAVDRARGTLWVAAGDAVVRIADAAGSPGTAATVVSDPGATFSGLAFDQVNTLYAARSDVGAMPPGSDGTRILRIPLGADGLAQRSPATEAIAGSGGSAGPNVSAAYTVPATPASQALDQLLSCTGGASGAFDTLGIDLSYTSDPTRVSGILLFVDSYSDGGAPGNWSQVLSLTPRNW